MIDTELPNQKYAYNLLIFFLMLNKTYCKSEI